MELRSRTLRRAVVAAALGALVVPAGAGAAVKLPVITKVTPKNVSVGETLIIHGKNFRRGKGKNTLLFKRNGGKALFVKTGLATTKQISVAVPKSLEAYMAVANGKPAATRFRLRVLTTKLSKAFTATKASPIVGPEKIKPATGTGTGTGTGGAGPVAPPLDPNADCDGDGLTNSFETGVTKTDPCNADSDGDGATDGYEYASAVDLNNDDYRHPTQSLPYPGKRPYPNPLDPSDINTDFDGDSLTLGEEYSLWRYTVQHGADPSLLNLTYSDGKKYSIRGLVASTYDKMADFKAWLVSSGYATIEWPDAPGVAVPFLDTNRNGVVDSTPQPGEHWVEDDYLDTHGVGFYTAPDGYLSDDERDEDADGLSNYVETHGPMLTTWYKDRYTLETPYPIDYAGTSPVDEDSDGDGVRDGADDQDHDDVPNFLELDRGQVSGRPQDPKNATPSDASPPFGRVNPYNPCLPFTFSRTCSIHPPFTGGWTPFDDSGYGDDYLVLN